MSTPVTGINIQDNTRHRGVLRVCERLAQRYGSSTNAISQLVRQSPEFRDAATNMGLDPDTLEPINQPDTTPQNGS